jgi:iron complex outermembrane receptor protein
MLGLLITLGLPVAVMAQGQTSAQEARPVRFDLPAGDLENSLHAFARQAGITLSFDPALVQGRHAAALSGTRGVQDGLAALLAPHQLRPRARPKAAGPCTARGPGLQPSMRCPR